MTITLLAPRSLRRRPHRAARLGALALAAAALGGTLAGCAPLLIGGAAVGGAMVFTDRRSPGIQIEDEAIETKVRNRVKDALGIRGNVSPTSYNRVVLLTGEVSAESDKGEAERVAAGVDNVRSVVNELRVANSQPFSSVSKDLVLTSKVRATLLDAKEVNSGAFKIVTERGTVYLMGRVSEAEATRAVEVVRSVPGVTRVVRVLEIMTEAELQALRPLPK
jgi:osmotically-inducible protein OsmY